MYAPIQNGIEKAVHLVRYTEAVPPDHLAKLVYCFWELKTDIILSGDFHYHVLPDACVDVVFNLSDVRAATIMTPHIKSETLNLGTSFHYVGIRFLPGVWQGNLEQIVGGFVDTPQVSSLPVSGISGELNGQSFAAQQTILSKVVECLTEENRVAISELTAILLVQADDIHSVADMARLISISPRQLQRNLKQMTGFSPHDFLKVLRLQRSFKQHYLASYVDQSHFIHSFRKITGHTPARYAKKFDV